MAKSTSKSKSVPTKKSVAKKSTPPKAVPKKPAPVKPAAKPTAKPIAKPVAKPSSLFPIDPDQTSALDLGCGPAPRNSFNAQVIVGVDLKASDNVLALDLVTDRLPFADHSFDFVTAFDVLQTIPRIIYNPERRMPFIELMNEIFRVLKPGGLFLSVTPIYPNEGAFRDPGHVNFITPETFSLYFDRGNNWAASYGFKGGFLIESQEASGPHHLVSNLRKPAD
jgi:SAM-dependent methyltransferase